MSHYRERTAGRLSLGFRQLHRWSHHSRWGQL